MPQRNILILLAAAVLSYTCYVRGDQSQFARYVAGGLATIEEDALQQVPEEELFAGAMEGMIGTLRGHGDEHSLFISEQDAGPFRAELLQQFGGIGVRIRLAGDPPQLMIVGVPEPGTPASRVHILPGDRILTIDDRPTAGLTMAEVLRLMRGAPGTSIRLTILHAADQQLETIDLVRETIMIDSILGDLREADGKWRFRLAADPRIAYIRVTTFANKTATELGLVLARLSAQGVEAVVLDLRDNSGGALDAAVEVCDMFLPPGLLIVETRGRDRELRDRYVSSGGSYAELPLAVIVNRQSASASEIVAACLQDHGRAVVVGERSFGKGTVQELIPMESGRSLLKLTSASYWRPSGKNIHRMPDTTPDDPWGVRPDSGFAVPITEQEYLAYRTYRSQRDLLEGSPTTDGSGDAAETAEADFSDRALEKAVEHLRSMLDD